MDREEFRELLNDIGNYHMPFGKFGPKDFPPRGVPLYDLPPEYLAWFAERGNRRRERTLSIRSVLRRLAPGFQLDWHLVINPPDARPG